MRDSRNWGRRLSAGGAHYTRPLSLMLKRVLQKSPFSAYENVHFGSTFAPPVSQGAFYSKSAQSCSFFGFCRMEWLCKPIEGSLLAAFDREPLLKSENFVHLVCEQNENAEHDVHVRFRMPADAKMP